MNSKSKDASLKRDLRRLLRSMDFVARQPALKRDTAEARRFAEIYQQLGLAWEFLALQCNHRGGWRKLRGGKSACKICADNSRDEGAVAVTAARQQENHWPPRDAKFQAHVSKLQGGNGGE